MTNKNLLSLAVNSTSEKAAFVEMESTRPGRKRNEYQQKKLADLKKIGASEDLENIIVAEKYLVDFERREYATGKATETSLANAKQDLEVIATNASQVKDPARYKEVDTNLAKDKMRDGNDLPLDGARKAFRSHITRLGNDEKSRGSEQEKAVIQERQQNMRIAEKLYIERQEKALGREHKEPPNPEPKPMTPAEFKKITEQFRAQAIKQGKDPELVDAALSHIAKNTKIKSPTPSKPKHTQDIKR
jgi:hypothetical protein